MDTSAMAHKAMTEVEKEKTQKEGQCFECCKQGHLAWNCPDQKPRAQSVEVTETPTEEGKKEGAKALTPAEVVKWLQQSSNKDKEAFIKAMSEAGEELGFLEAWMLELS